jgi:hypothetical protein
MTLDSATELLLGESFHSQLTHSAPETKAFVESFDFATRNVYLYDALRNGFLMPLGLFYWTMRRGGKDKFTRSCEAVHKAIDDRITRQLQQGFGAAAEAKRYVFLEGLAQETSDKKQIRDEILSVLFAGRDSTGSSLANVMFMMARKPEAWKQVREEVMNVTQGNLPDATMLRQMKFLRNVLNESTYMPIRSLVPSSNDRESFVTLQQSSLPLLTNSVSLPHSPPSVPTHPSELPPGKRQHNPPTRRRPRRPIPPLHRSRNPSPIPRLRRPPLLRNVRPHRPRMGPLALGRSVAQTGMGLFAVSKQNPTTPLQD